MLADEIYFFVRRSIKEIKDELESVSKEHASALLLQSCIEEKINSITFVSEEEKKMLEEINILKKKNQDAKRIMEDLGSMYKDVNETEDSIMDQIYAGESDSDMLEVDLKKIKGDEKEMMELRMAQMRHELKNSEKGGNVFVSMLKWIVISYAFYLAFTFSTAYYLFFLFSLLHRYFDFIVRKSSMAV